MTAPKIEQTGGGKKGGGKKKADGPKTNAEAAFEFLKSKGLTAQQAAGVVSNMMAESSVNPASNAYDVNGRSVGIVQWHDNPSTGLSLATDLMNAAKKAGVSWKNLHFQLEYFYQQLKTSYSSVYRDIVNSSTAVGAAGAMAGYERYQGWDSTSSHGYQRHISYADSILHASETGNWSAVGGSVPSGGTGGAGGYTAGAASAGGGGDLASVIAAALAPSAVAKRSYKDYLGYLYNKGLDPTPEAINFAHFAAQHQLSTSEFDAELYQQGWFKDEFPGIFNSKGGLIMSPRAYTDQYRSFAGLATSYGFPLSKQQFGYMVKNNQLDSTMFQDKLYAVHTVEANRQTMRAFENVLRSKGLVKGKLSDEELYKFVMRQAPPDWYKVWDEGAAVTGAVNAGIHFGADITRAQVARLIKQNPDFDYMARTPGGIRAEQAKWYKVAQDLKTIAPPSRLYQDHGLKASDLAELEFGGPRAADVYDKAQRALAAYKSSSMPEAHTGLSSVENRVGSQVAQQIQAGVPR